jgi:hypothetical protein
MPHVGEANMRSKLTEYTDTGGNPRDESSRWRRRMKLGSSDHHGLFFGDRQCILALVIKAPAGLDSQKRSAR